MGIVVESLSKVYRDTIAVETWFVLASDARYEDTALAASRVQQARLERIRQGGLGVHRSKVSRSITWNLPRLGGVGPVAWVELIRLGRLSLPVKAFALLTPMAAAWFIVRFERRDPRVAIVFVTMLVAYIALVSSPLYGSSLRGAPPLMAKLKALPLAPTALVAGLMLPGVAVLTALHALAYAVCVAIRPSLWPWAATGLAFSLVFNGLLLAMEDWASLQVPSPDGNSDGVRSVASRTVFLSVLKMIGTALAAGVASAVGILTGWLSHSLEWGLCSFPYAANSGVEATAMLTMLTSSTKPRPFHAAGSHRGAMPSALSAATSSALAPVTISKFCPA